MIDNAICRFRTVPVQNERVTADREINRNHLDSPPSYVDIMINSKNTNNSQTDTFLNSNLNDKDIIMAPQPPPYRINVLPINNK